MLKDLMENHNEGNIIYKCADLEEYNKVPELLKKDYGYLDILLDFKDLDRIKPLLSTSEDFERDFVYLDYINYNILKKADAHVDDFDIDKYGESIYTEDADIYLSSNYVVDFKVEVTEALKRKALTKNGTARIHFMLDNFNDDALQKNINNLFITQKGIVMLGYTAKPFILNNSSKLILLDGENKYIGKQKKRGVL